MTKTCVCSIVYIFQILETCIFCIAFTKDLHNFIGVLHSHYSFGHDYMIIVWSGKVLIPNIVIGIYFGTLIIKRRNASTAIAGATRVTRTKYKVLAVPKFSVEGTLKLMEPMNDLIQCGRFSVFKNGMEERCIW